MARNCELRGEEDKRGRLSRGKKRVSHCVWVGTHNIRWRRGRSRGSELAEGLKGAQEGGLKVGKDE